MVQWHIWLLKSSQQRCILTQILKFYDKISCCFFPCQTKHSKIWHCKGYCRRWLCRNSLTEVCVLLKKKIHSDFTSFKTKASDLFIYLFHQFCGRLRTWAGHSGLLLKQSFGQSEKQACLFPSDVGNPWEQACRSCSNRWWVELVTEEILAHWTALCTGGWVYNTHGAAGGHTECLLIGDNCRGPLGHRHQAVLILMVLWSSDGWCLRARGTASLLAKCVSRIGMEGFGYMHIKIPITQLCYPYR